MADRIVKTVVLDAPVSRVWRALADHNEFGRWFRVKLDQPVQPGSLSTGKMTEVAAVEKFPAYILYQTVWLDGQGKLVYGADVYKRDRDLIEALAKTDGFVIPGADHIRQASLSNDESFAALAYNQ